MATLSIQAALITKLAAASAVTNIRSTRIYPGGREQGAALPCQVYNVIDQIPEHHLNGGAGLVVARIQIDNYAETERQCHLLAEATREALQGFRGTITSGSDSLVIQMVECEQGGQVDPIAPQSAQGPVFFRNSQDFKFGYAQSVPSHS